MPAVSDVELTGDAYVDGLLSNWKWAVDTLTFSFPTRASFYEPGYGLGEPKTGFEGLNATQQSVARASFTVYGQIADLQFVEVTETSTEHGDLRSAMSDVPDTAWTYYPGTTPASGDSWFNNSSRDYDSPAKGNYAYATFVHELGHGLGLEHAHEGNVMPLERDSLEYTVMSYSSYVGAPIESGYSNETWGYPQSLMMYDIAALHHMYGPNYATNSGNTTYAWSPTTGEMFIDGAGQGAPGANRIFVTVWDGSGTDTYDFSAYADDLDVDLRPGHWTTTSVGQLARLDKDGSQLAAGTIANALLFNDDPRALIENAKGGSGHDVMVGNAGANAVWGQDGDDRLYGLAGHDTLVGGAGADTLYGQGGNDRLYGGDGHDVLAGGGGRDVLVAGAGDDRLYGQGGDDVLKGGGGRDVLVGHIGDDRLYGHGDDDVLKGGDGHDVLAGGGGRDVLVAGAGDDRLYGQGGDDVLKGGGGRDVLVGHIGDDRLYGHGDDDVLKGGDGHDGLVGGAGDDVLYGHGGNDHLYGGHGHDILVGGPGDDALLGQAGDDRLYAGGGNDRLLGRDGADVLRGGEGGDLLSGDAGDDRLFGEAGNDVLIGGTGRDLLYGGLDADRFLFRSILETPPSVGRDIIGDFSSAENDLIHLRLIDADVSTAEDDPFVFIDTTFFSGTAGELRYGVNGAGHAIVQGDVDGDVSSDFEILVLNTSVLSADDFLL